MPLPEHLRPKTKQVTYTTIDGVDVPDDVDTDVDQLRKKVALIRRVLKEHDVSELVKCVAIMIIARWPTPIDDKSYETALELAGAGVEATKKRE